MFRPFLPSVILPSVVFYLRSLFTFSHSTFGHFLPSVILPSVIVPSAIVRSVILRSVFLPSVFPRSVILRSVTVSYIFFTILSKNGVFRDFYVNKYGKLPVYDAVFVYCLPGFISGPPVNPPHGLSQPPLSRKRGQHSFWPTSAQLGVVASAASRPFRSRLQTGSSAQQGGSAVSMGFFPVCDFNLYMEVSFLGPTASMTVPRVSIRKDEASSASVGLAGRGICKIGHRGVERSRASLLSPWLCLRWTVQLSW
jgi:hypothetical protein